jgi:hypothetical protein
MRRLRYALFARPISFLLIGGMLVTVVPLPWSGQVAAYISWLERQLRGPEGMAVLRLGLPEVQRVAIRSPEAFVQVFVAACEREGVGVLLRRALALPEQTPTSVVVAHLLDPVTRMHTESATGPLWRAVSLLSIGTAVGVFGFFVPEGALLSAAESALLVLRQLVALPTAWLYGTIYLRGP